MSALSERLRVLIVENDEPDAILVKRALRRSMPEVSTFRADCVASALEVLAQGSVDVAIVAWCLPDGSGAHVTQGCADVAPRTPIVLMSRGDRRAPSQRVGVDAQAFVSKNELTPTGLRDTLLSVVQGLRVA